jgi:YVTN family beta-propeller protein
MPGEVLGIAADPARDRVYVNDWYGQRVLVIDTKTLRQIHTAATGKVPAGLAVSHTLELLVVACRDDNTLCLHRLPSLDRVATIAVGRAPFGVTLDAAGTRAYVANVQSDSVSVVDLAKRRVLAEIAVGDSPYATALDESRQRLVVTNQQAGSLSVIDLRSMKTERTISVAEYPEGIAYSPALDQYFVASWFENLMLVFAGRDLTQVASLACGDGPRAFGDFILPPVPRAIPP